MILSDGTIREMLHDGRSDTLKIMGLGGMEQIEPASVDVRLGNSFSIISEPRCKVIGMDRPVEYTTVTCDSYILDPGQFVLATTMESFRLGNGIIAFVEGRSSLGRIGLFVQNAGWVDPGFEGQITLELYNASSNPIELIAGRRIAQMVFGKTDMPVQNPYHGKYQGQSGATGSRVFMDRESKNNG